MAEKVGVCGAWQATQALHMYRRFSTEVSPTWGRATFEYFVSQGLDGGRLNAETKPFRPVNLSASNFNSSFGTVLLDYRVALATQCIVDASRRPTEARYRLPEYLADRPYWDCTSFPIVWSTETSRVENMASRMAFGGAAIWRLASPQGAKISVSPSANPEIRTKILAAGDDAGLPAQVIELRPGESAVLGGGPREVFVVQVNADPVGDLLQKTDLPKRWTRGSCPAADSTCRGRAWTTVHEPTAKPSDDYAVHLSGLRTPVLDITENATLSMDVAFEINPVFPGEVYAGETARNSNWPWPGCLFHGALVRVHIYKTGKAAMEAKSEGDRFVTLVPTGPAGYDISATEKTSRPCPNEKYQYPPMLTSRSGIPTDGMCANAMPETAEQAPSCSCNDLPGWIRSSSDCENEKTRSADGAWKFLPFEFSLAPFVGMAVQLELMLAADFSSSDASGLWVDNFAVRTNANPSKVLFSDDADTADPSLMEEVYLPQAPPAATPGRFDDAPVAAELPPGFAVDALVLKAEIFRRAPWDASWETKTKSARRAYVGWSYSSSIEDTRSAKLKPDQEACMVFTPAFEGALTVITYFGARDKVGVDSIALILRSAVEPFAPLGPALTRPSAGISDQAVHRFVIPSGSTRRVLKAKTPTLLCIGIGSIRQLPTDLFPFDPYLVMPLTNVSAANRTNHAVMLYRNSSTMSAKVDPWGPGYSLPIRAEYEEIINSGGPGPPPNLPTLKPSSLISTVAAPSLQPLLQPSLQPSRTAPATVSVGSNSRIAPPLIVLSTASLVATIHWFLC